MESMCDDLRGDVLKLRDKGNRYRLRIRTFSLSWRETCILIYAVKDRKKAYD
jgi:hypothetical protein